VGFFRGFLAPFRGGLFIAREKLWGYLAVPLLLNVALGVGTIWAGAHYVRQELGDHFTKSPIVAWLILIFMATLWGIVFFIVLQALLGAFFNDLLSEKVEHRARGHAHSTPLLASVGRSLVHGLLMLALYGIAFVTGLGLAAVSGIGSLAGVALGGLFLAYDGFDYPLSRRGLSFGAKWRYLALHPGLTLGYGLGASVLYIIPLAFLLAPPLAAAGATLAFLDSEPKTDSKTDPKTEPKTAPKADQPTDPKTSSPPAGPTQGQTTDEKSALRNG
jgi:uncharacterized protein involved in cysteine biosynthesis